VGSSTALGTGALTFASGTTLQAAANGLSLANAVTLNGTDTVDTQSNALTLSGTLSGSGGLAKIGQRYANALRQRQLFGRDSRQRQDAAGRGDERLVVEQCVHGRLRRRPRPQQPLM
jgi:hypothetical protein